MCKILLTSCLLILMYLLAIFFKANYVICVQKKSQGIKALEVRKSTTDEQTIIVSAAIYKPAFATSFLSETIVLGERNLINVFRTKELFFIRLCITVHNSTIFYVCVCVSLSLSPALGST